MSVDLAKYTRTRTIRTIELTPDQIRAELGLPENAKVTLNAEGLAATWEEEVEPTATRRRRKPAETPAPTEPPPSTPEPAQAQEPEPATIDTTGMP
jgi:hypothetical protein